MKKPKLTYADYAIESLGFAIRAARRKQWYAMNAHAACAAMFAKEAWLDKRSKKKEVA